MDMVPPIELVDSCALLLEVVDGAREVPEVRVLIVWAATLAEVVVTLEDSSTPEEDATGLETDVLVVRVVVGPTT